MTDDPPLKEEVLCPVLALIVILLLITAVLFCPTTVELELFTKIALFESAPLAATEVFVEEEEQEQLLTDELVFIP